MRFVPIILLFTVAASSAFAAPGDKYSPESNWSDKPATKRQFRSDDKPVAPEGFTVRKIISNLGDISSLAIVDDDVFVADASQDRILRLKRRNMNNAFETRAEYLIGFNQLNDIVSANGDLYMSDKTGVWTLKAGNTLVATEAPKLIFRVPAPQSGHPISLAPVPNEKALVIGYGHSVFTLDTLTGKHQEISRNSWQVQDIAVSPSGSIWASVTQNNSAYIAPIRPGTDRPKMLKLPPKTRTNDLHFWNKETYANDWPQKWSSDLIVSMDGNHPMIARAHFNYGDVDAEFTSFIEGFSEPSRFVGRRSSWGAPTAIGLLSNGQMIFAEEKQGALWILEKDEQIIVATGSVPEAIETSEPETEPEKKPSAPSLLKGSSIKSASSLETDELLRRSTQPDQGPQKNED